jgi:hypothetical protein
MVWLTLTLSVQFHLVHFRERQTRVRSRDGMADTEPSDHERAQHLSFGASSTGAVCLQRTTEAVLQPLQARRLLASFGPIDGRKPRKPDLPPDLAILARVVHRQSPTAQELFHYALVILLIEDGKAEIIERRTVDAPQWLTVRRVAGECDSHRLCPGEQLSSLCGARARAGGLPNRNTGRRGRSPRLAFPSIG